MTQIEFSEAMNFMTLSFIESINRATGRRFKIEYRKENLTNPDVRILIEPLVDRLHPTLWKNICPKGTSDTDELWISMDQLIKAVSCFNEDFLTEANDGLVDKFQIDTEKLKADKSLELYPLLLDLFAKFNTGIAMARKYGSNLNYIVNNINK